MDEFRLFIPITKVDVEQRLVYGTMTHETPDASGEIMDYASAKPEFEKWSNAASARSNGQSKGNVRAMHTSIAAGKLTDIKFDDDRKAIDGVAKVVDDAEWKKVLEGVYTGFSIGGRYIRRWTDPDNSKLMRFTPEPSEVSLVDNPCCPTACFSMVKADGSVTQIPFKHKEITVDKDALRKSVGANIQQGWLTKDNTFYPRREDAIEHDVKAEVAAIEKREFTDKERASAAASGEAMPDGSFPIKDEKDLHNAVHAIGRAKEPAKAKAHIISRAKALNATHVLPADWEGSTKTPEAEKVEKQAAVKKDMDDVARAACIIEHLNWLCLSVSFEEKIEGDEDSDSAAHLESIIHELCEYLTTRVAEETSEILENHDAENYIMELAAGLPKNEADAVVKQINVGKDAAKFEKLIAALGKAGARHSAADKEHGAKLVASLGKMKDHMEGLGKCFGKMTKAMGDMEDHHEGMEDAHEKMGATEKALAADNYTAVGKAMGEHIEGMGKALHKMEKAHGDAVEHHEEMEECHKDALAGSEAVGFGTGTAEHKDPETETEKAAQAEELRKAALAGTVPYSASAELKKLQAEFSESLKKIKDDADAAIKAAQENTDNVIAENAELEKKHAAFADDIAKRMKKLEDQPIQKGAVYAVRKGHEVEAPENTPPVEIEHSVTRGMSPADARRFVTRG